MNMSEMIAQVKAVENESSRLLTEIKGYIPAGASSTMRVLEYHKPLVVKEAHGVRIKDADGKELIDYNMGYGPLIFGHRSEIINGAVKDQLDISGAIIGFSSPLYKEVGELICEAYPSIERMRFAMTGSEVNQTAVRLAREYTGRNHIILFEGHYHGSTDSLYHHYNCDLDEINPEDDYTVASGTNGMAGAPHNAYELPWNEPDILAKFLAVHGRDIGAMIMEPVMGNSGVILPQQGFLETVRELCDRYGIVLIFDEIITGSRIARGGAQEKYQVRSDLTTLSKAAIGGFPGSVIGGRKEIMELLTANRVFHGGVYSGNPLTLRAALATQKEYRENGNEIYDGLNRRSDRLASGMKDLFQEAGIPVCINHAGAMLSLFFLKESTPREILSFRDFAKTDKVKHICFQHILQDMGVYFHPNDLEPWYLSTAHTDGIIDQTLDVIGRAIRSFKERTE